MRKAVGWIVLGILTGAWALSLEGETKPPAKPVTVVALVDGMTCERCPLSLSQSLQRVKGVVKAEVSFKDRRAVIVLDETKTPLSALTTVKTAHHQFRLIPLLPVDKADRERAVRALKEVKGVEEGKVVDEGVAVTLKPNETVRYGDLVATLQKAGIPVRDWPESSQGRENRQDECNDDCCSPPSKGEQMKSGGCC